jgi:hypothetical protein
MTTCRQTSSEAPARWAWFLCFLVTLTKTPLVDAARFAVTGPVLTITLKDPATSSRSSNNNDESSPSWGLDLRELHPTLNWSVQSKSKPLPNWLPSLQSIRSSLGYHYQDSYKYIPSNLESEAVFAASSRFFKGVSLKVQPSYEFRSQRGFSLQLQATKGTSSYALAHFTSTGKSWLKLLKGCLQIDLPYASVGGIRITPSYDVTRNEPSCSLEATTGSQRTKAIVNLEYQNPTLSIAHTLAEWYVRESVWGYDCVSRLVFCVGEILRQSSG